MGKIQGLRYSLLLLRARFKLVIIDILFVNMMSLFILIFITRQLLINNSVDTEFNFRGLHALYLLPMLLLLLTLLFNVIFT